MAIERYANAAQTTLAAAVTTTDGTSLSVTSAALFPTNGNFRVLIDTELLIVTGVSGTTFTVIRGAENTTAATHLNGALMTLIVTAQSVVAAGLSALYGRPFRTPPPTSWAWVNQGDATAGSTGYGYGLYLPKTASVNVRGLVTTLPSAPYTLTCVWRGLQPTANYSSLGLILRQSSDGKLVVFIRNNTGSFFVQKWSSPTSYSAEYATVAVLNGGGDPLCFRVVDDTTDRRCQVSIDGVNFTTVHSVGRTDYLTADQIGFGGQIQQTTLDQSMVILDWSME